MLNAQRRVFARKINTELWEKGKIWNGAKKSKCSTNPLTFVSSLFKCDWNFFFWSHGRVTWYSHELSYFHWKNQKFHIFTFFDKFQNKFQITWKATNFEKINPENGRFFQNFVAFSEYLKVDLLILLDLLTQPYIPISFLKDSKDMIISKVCI